MDIVGSHLCRFYTYPVLGLWWVCSIGVAYCVYLCFLVNHVFLVEQRGMKGPGVVMVVSDWGGGGWLGVTIWGRGGG